MVLPVALGKPQMIGRDLMKAPGHQVAPERSIDTTENITCINGQARRDALPFHADVIRSLQHWCPGCNTCLSVKWPVNRGLTATYVERGVRRHHGHGSRRGSGF